MKGKNLQCKRRRKEEKKIKIKSKRNENKKKRIKTKWSYTAYTRTYTHMRIKKEKCFLHRSVSADAENGLSDSSKRCKPPMYNGNSGEKENYFRNNTQHLIS